MKSKKTTKSLLTMLAVVITIGIGVFIYVVNYTDRNEAVARIYPTSEASRKGLNWLLNYPKNVADPAVLWAMDDMNKKYCHKSEVENFVADKFQEFKNDPVNIAYQRLLTGDTSYRYTEADLQNSLARFDYYLTIPALYCDQQQIPLEAEQRIFDIENTKGYELTHQFIGMLFLEEQGCKNRQSDTEFGDALAKTAQKIADEQDGAVFDDLYVERVALLEYAGFPNMVKADWIQAKADSQQSDGSWLDPVHGQEEVRVHITVLATWALVLHEGVCPVP